MFWIVLATLAQAMIPPVMTLAQGSNSQISEKTEVVVRTSADWQALWKRHGRTDPPPAVDFTKQMVAAVFLGERSTGGYRVEIVGAQREQNALVMDYVERKPGPDDIVSQALTSPFHVVALAKQEGAVRFRAIPPPPSPR